MISFDASHRAVHYPPDRRFRIWLQPSVVTVVLALVGVPLMVAWVQAAVFGLPDIRPILPGNGSALSPHGFPAWVRYCHFFNLLFLMMLIRSGLSILMDHPRLYFNDDCTPGTEWIRLTPLSDSDGPRVDGKGRCAVHLAARCHCQVTAIRSASLDRGTSSMSMDSSSPAYFSSACSSARRNGNGWCRPLAPCSCRRGTLSCITPLSLSA